MYGRNFTIKMAFKKRRERGLQSWALFLDLVKAFDRVPREMIWEILAEFDILNKIIRLLKVLHANFVVKFTVDDVTQCLDCIIGVKQSHIFGPILLKFFIAAVMITCKASCNTPICMSRSTMDATLTGRSYRVFGKSFPVLGFKYADDTAINF